jgi:hypothetical protein
VVPKQKISSDAGFYYHLSTRNYSLKGCYHVDSRKFSVIGKPLIHPFYWFTRENPQYFANWLDSLTPECKQKKEKEIKIL